MIPCIFITKKLNKIKFASIIIVVLFFILPFCARSQQRKMGRNQPLNLPTESIRLDSLSHLIANESNFIFSFNATQIDPGKRIMVPVAIKRLNDLLTYLKEQYKLDHKTIGNHIILYNRASLNKKAESLSTKPHRQFPQKKAAILNKEKTDEALSLKKHPVHSTILPDIKTNSTLKITSFNLPTKLTHLVINPDFIPQLKSSSFRQTKILDSYSKQDNSRKRKNAHNPHRGMADHSFYISAGVTANDVLYLNPKIRLGLPWLYASAAWETNFNVSGFFYGIGTRIRLTDSWDLRLSVSNGTLSEEYKLGSPSDSILRIKTRITGINFLVEKQFGTRLSLELGPVLNLMKNNYSLIDLSLGNSSLPVASNLSMGYHIIQPHYTLSENYNERKNAGTKIWIGLQIGLFYRLW